MLSLNLMRTLQTSLITLLTFTVTACGGGGGSDSENKSEQTKSTVTAVSPTPKASPTNPIAPSLSITLKPNNPEPKPAEKLTESPELAKTAEVDPAIESDIEPLDELAEERPLTSTITISWVAPSSRENGSPSELSEISGYEIHYFLFGSGEDEGETVMIEDPSETQYTTPELTAGTYYFDIETIDTEGIHSEPSEPVEVIIQ